MADEELDRTGELLIEAGLITEEEIAKAAEDAGGVDSRILDAVRKSGHPRRSELAAFLAMDYAIQEISLPGFSIPKEVLKLVPEDFARKHVLVPVAVLGKSVLVIARPNIFNRAAVIALRKMTGLKVAVLRAAESEVESAINAGYLGMPWPKAAPKSPTARSAEAAALAVPVAGKTPGFETAHFPTLRPDELSPSGRETAAPAPPPARPPAPEEDLAHSLLMTPDDVAASRAGRAAVTPRTAPPETPSEGYEIDLMDSPASPAQPAPAPAGAPDETEAAGAGSGFADADLEVLPTEEEKDIFSSPPPPGPAPDTRKISVPRKLVSPPIDERAAMANRSTAMMLMAIAATEEELSRARRDSFQVAIEEWERSFTQDRPLVAVRMSR